MQAEIEIEIVVFLQQAAGKRTDIGVHYPL